MNLHARIEERIERLGYRKRQIDKLIGKKLGYTSNMLANRSEPSAMTLLALSNILQTTPNDLLGYAGRYTFTDKHTSEIEELIAEETSRIAGAIHQKALEKLCPAGRTPHIAEVIGWAISSGGILRQTDDINQFFTTYTEPTVGDTAPTAIQVGKSSLAAQTLLVQTPDQLNRILQEMPADYASSLTHQQITVGESQPAISLEKISLELPKLSVNVDFDYVRLYLKLRNEEGEKVVLNFSEPVART